MPGADYDKYEGSDDNAAVGGEKRAPGKISARTAL